jgi:hypothetical protein
MTQRNRMPKVANPRPRPIPAGQRGGPQASGAAVAADDNLDVTYAHVRRDLRRIFLMAIVLFAFIYASQYL